MVIHFILLFSTLSTFGTALSGPPFQFVDVSASTGIGPIPNDKTSSPSIADLDQDGYLDIVMCNHVRYPVEVYYGNAFGKFRRILTLRGKWDRHGTALGDIDGNGKIDIVLATEWNGNKTLYPCQAEVSKSKGGLLLLNPEQDGLVGRVLAVAPRLFDIDQDGDLDLFILGRRGGHPETHAMYRNDGSGNFTRISTGIENATAYVGFLFTDFNGDGFLDVFLFSPGILVFQGLPHSQFQDVTAKVLPTSYRGYFNGAVAFDADNDGDFDVYLSGGYRDKSKLIPGSDVFLENRGGFFVDISRSAKALRGGGRAGITAADFDNDGFVDLFLPSVGSGSQRIPDFILWNLGNMTFGSYTNHGANSPLALDITYPSGAQAFDYDRDGLVDVIVGTRYRNESTPLFYTGNLRLFKNVLETKNSYLIIKVPPSIQNKSTMDALLAVTTNTGTFYRRVGSVGESRTQSFIDQVHFGLGLATSVENITLALLDGTMFVLNSSRSTTLNQMIAFF